MVPSRSRYSRQEALYARSQRVLPVTRESVCVGVIDIAFRTYSPFASNSSSFASNFLPMRPPCDLHERLRGDIAFRTYPP